MHICKHTHLNAVNTLGLKFVHSAGVLHRDLKPSNILVNANCDCKIADFGMARTSDPIASEKYMTGYVTTRWYRAPEVILSWRNYTKAVDMWSVGCILAELVGRTPIFPGKDYNQQLRLIFTTMGTPTPSDLSFIKCADTKKKVLSMSHKAKIPLKTLYPHATPRCLRLMEHLLEFSPKKRATVTEALKHPYLEQLHDPEDEPEASSVFDFEFERMDLDEAQCKRLLWEEACRHHTHLKPAPDYAKTKSLVESKST